MKRESAEIRLHGRGGQGGVTCAKILATFYARLGRSVQTFGDYAGERSGAPVRAYTRIATKPITNRNKVYRPDQVVVLDPTLLGDDVIAGLAPQGLLLVNTTQDMAQLAARFAPFTVAAVDATGIARRHRIGTRSVVIVNTTIAGAYAAVNGIPLVELEAAYEHLGFASNFAAAHEAFEAVRWREPQAAADKRAPAWVPRPPARVLPLTEHREGAPTQLKTGSWRTQEPHYVEKLAPCTAFCPAGNDVIGFVRALATSGEAAAAEILARSTPFPGVCGHVCPAPCMEGCNRRELDGAVNIRGIERWIASHAVLAPAEPVPAAEPFRIAVIGGGPAGLAAAYTIAKAGHRAVVFEKDAQLGGLLQTGIPEFRLPRELVNREIAAVLALGVEARCGVALGRDDLATLAEEYDALILATGLQRQRPLEVPGTTLPGVEQGVGFLRRVNLEGMGSARVRGSVVVLGGGNTAIDCARTALRCGAEQVIVAYRRTRTEMPAIAEEVAEAEEEGVRFLFQRQPMAVRGGARVSSIDLEEVAMGEPDSSGRRRPVGTGRRENVACDHVLVALGQVQDLSLLPPGWELCDRQIMVGDGPMRVYAAGDVAGGEGTVTHAIGTGRTAAARALRGLGADTPPIERPDRSLAVPATEIHLDHFERRPAAHEQLEPAESRVQGFALVNRGLKDGSEAERCFSCGHCTRCDTCLVYCPEGVIRREGPGYGVDLSFCKGCGICVQECPRKAVEMRPL